jgi:hypothetical protein
MMIEKKNAGSVQNKYITTIPWWYCLVPGILLTVALVDLQRVVA